MKLDATVWHTLPNGGQVRIHVEFLTMDIDSHAYVAGLSYGQIHPLLQQPAKDAMAAIVQLAETIDSTRVRE